MQYPWPLRVVPSFGLRRKCILYLLVFNSSVFRTRRIMSQYVQYRGYVIYRFSLTRTFVNVLILLTFKVLFLGIPMFPFITFLKRIASSKAGVLMCVFFSFVMSGRRRTARMRHQEQLHNSWLYLSTNVLHDFITAVFPFFRKLTYVYSYISPGLGSIKDAY